MPPKTFYLVDPAAYLFGQQDTPEEQVRQWALFELLSTYGINIQNIKIEQRARMGSRTYKADIVVLKSGDPYIVVECKRFGDRKVEEALEQAESYANYFNAPFVVCTNGERWLVKHRVDSGWVPIPDIEREADQLQLGNLAALLWLLENLKPLLYWLYDQSVPSQYSKEFMEKMQVLFHNNNELFADTSVDLYLAVEFLLRVVANYQSVSVDYILENLRTSVKQFILYFNRIGFTHIVSDDWPVDELINMLVLDLGTLHQNSTSVKSKNAALVGLAAEIARYLQNIWRRGHYLDVPGSVIGELKEFIDFFLNERLKVQLPDRLDGDGITALKTLCKDGWG